MCYTSLQSVVALCRKTTRSISAAGGSKISECGPNRRVSGWCGACGFGKKCCDFMRSLCS